MKKMMKIKKNEENDEKSENENQNQHESHASQKRELLKPIQQNMFDDEEHVKEQTAPTAKAKRKGRA